MHSLTLSHLIVGAVASTFGKTALALGAKGIVLKIVAFLSLVLPFFGAAVDETTMANLLKTVYSPDRIQSLVYKRSRLLQWLKKDTGFSGDSLTVPIHYGNPSGGSHSWSKAKTNRTASKYTKFVLDVIDDFDFLEFDHKTLMRARKDVGSFLKAKEPQINNLLEAAGRRMGIEVYGNGSGRRGRLSATQALHSKTLQLDVIAEATNFEIGDVLALATDAPAYGAAAGAGVEVGTVEVSGVDLDLGQLTITEFLDTAIPTAAVSMYLFIDGDYQAGATGLEAWLPVTAPGATDNFWGVNRSVYPTRLAGIRYDGTSDTSLQSLVVKFANKVNRLNGQKGLEAIFCPTSFFSALEDELGAKTSYYDPDDEAVATIGFAALRVNYQGGSVPLVPDFDCPVDRLFAPDRETFTVHSMGDAPSIFDADGNTMVRSTDANSLMLQTFAYWNLGCNAPGLSGVAEIEPQEAYY